MPHFNLSLDGQDRARVHDITAMPLINPCGLGAEIYSDKNRTSAGNLLRLLIYHCDRFHAELLPQLEIPPVVGVRRGLCFNMGQAEHTILARLAGECSWSMTDVLRALIEHHWEIRQDYKATLPGLTYVTRGMLGCALSFAPDRLQPWYYHKAEKINRIEATAKRDLAHLEFVLKDHGISEAVAKAILEDVDGGPGPREQFAWKGPGVSPEAIREAEYKSEM